MTFIIIFSISLCYPCKSEKWNKYFQHFFKEKKLSRGIYYLRQNKEDENT